MTNTFPCHLSSVPISNPLVFELIYHPKFSQIFPYFISASKWRNQKTLTSSCGITTSVCKTFLLLFIFYLTLSSFALHLKNHKSQALYMFLWPPFWLSCWVTMVEDYSKTYSMDFPHSLAIHLCSNKQKLESVSWMCQPQAPHPLYRLLIVFACVYVGTACSLALLL